MTVSTDSRKKFGQLYEKAFAFVCFAVFIPFTFAYADLGGFTNSGGTLSGGSTVVSRGLYSWLTAVEKASL